MRQSAGAALLTLLMPVGASAADRSNDISGSWSSADADHAVIALHLCPEGLCGDIVRQPHSGAEFQVVGGFSRVSRTHWTGGRIYNLNDGATYVVDVELLDAARLKVRACWLGFCERQLWRRVD